MKKYVWVEMRQKKNMNDHARKSLSAAAADAFFAPA